MLAADASPTWGVYSGYELVRELPVRPGSEEYLDSEKYQYSPRDWEAAERRAAACRRSSPNSICSEERTRRCSRLRNLRFHSVDQPE